MKIFNEIYDWSVTLVTSFTIALLINVFVFQPTQVIGSSMQPTLNDHDYIIVSKLSHTLNREPNYNDIVIIDSRVSRDRTWKDDLSAPALTYLTALGIAPTSTGHEVWVKRVIGKAGDVLEFKDQQVYRNGIAIEEPYIKEAMRYTTDNKIIVPEGHIFVLGDNRNNSSDSRYIGPVKVDHVLGTMAFKL